jgi:hypothetical protein
MANPPIAAPDDPDDPDDRADPKAGPSCPKLSAGGRSPSTGDGEPPS